MSLVRGWLPSKVVAPNVYAMQPTTPGEDLSIGCEQGVTADYGSIHGLEDDYATFSKRGQRGDQDLWGQHLQNLIRTRLGN